MLRAHDQRARGDLRPAARARDDDRVRQPGLDRAADAGGLPRRLPLRPRPAGGRRRRAWPTATRRPAGRPAHVNLHTAPGRRQRDGRDLQRPGQQGAAADHRGPAGPLADDAAGQPDQPRRRAHAAPAGEVELRAAARRRTSRTRSRGRSTSRRCRRAGPAFVSIPMDDWDAEVDDARGRPPDRAHASAAAPRPTPRRSRALAERLRGGASARRSSPAPTSTRRGGWDAAVALAERQRLAVWATPAAGRRADRLPRGPPALPGHPAAGDRARWRRCSPATTWCSSPGSSVFPYYPNIPGAAARRRAPTLVAITSDPDEAARAPMGDAIVADVALTLAALADAVGEADRPAAGRRGPRPSRRRADRPAEPLDRRPRVLAEVLPRGRRSCARVAVEHARAAQPAAPVAARQLLLLRRRRPRASACRRRSASSSRSRPPGRVRARRGLGAVRDQGFWTRRRLRRARHVPRAAQRRVRDPQVVRRCSRTSTGAPGLDLPALDVAATAASYGVPASSVPRPGSWTAALGDALGGGARALVEVDVAPGMALG